MQSNPNAEDDQRDAPTEVVIEAQAETSSHARTINRPADPGTWTRRPTLPVTQIRTEVIVVDSDNSDEEPLANLRDHTNEISALRAEIAAEKRCDVKALKPELKALKSCDKRQVVSPKLSNSEDESGDKRSERGQDSKGKKKRPSKGERRMRRKEEEEVAITLPKPPSKALGCGSPQPKSARLWSKERIQRRQRRKRKDCYSA